MSLNWQAAAGADLCIEEELTAPLSCTRTPAIVMNADKDPTFIIDNVGGQAEYAKASEVNGTLRAGAQGLVAYAVENHPADSRVNIDESGKVQTLTSRMGTGGGNVPMVMEPKEPVIVQPILHASKASYFMRAAEGVADTLVATDYKDPQLVAYGLDRASFTQVTEDVSPTLMARDWKDPTRVCSNYIVRRLTPTECARLQGFADWWGVIEPKDSLTDEEYHFWCEVYLTKQIIDGKVEYDENGKLRYTESKKPFTHKRLKRMLTWYNKLWTDSAEYKMWGNGIALPTALYCVQGVVEALMNPIEAEFEECDEDDWMN